MDTSIKKMTKNILSEFNLEEARGWTIHCLLQIEHSIDQIITDYYEPKQKDKFKRIMLNSSILDFGSKCKILCNIDSVKNSTVDSIRKLSSIRNSLAHAEIIDNITIIVDKENDKASIGSITSKIDVMNSSGKISSEDAYKYLCKFLGLYDVTKKELIELKKKSNNAIHADPRSAGR